MWVNLHNHSYFSFLRGLASPLELAQAAAARHMPALAMTDSGFLTGAIEFYDACQTQAVRPILGLEAFIKGSADRLLVDGLSAASGNLVLLAQDMTGWANLCQLSSLLQTDQVAGLTLEHLEQHSQGLICLTGGRGGFAAEALVTTPWKTILPWFERLAAEFPDRLYIELQAWLAPLAPTDLRWATQLLRLSRQLRLPMLASVDIHYLDPQASHLQRLVSAIRQNTRLSDLATTECALPGSHFLSEEELIHSLASYPIEDPGRLLETSIAAADRCQLQLPLGEQHYPRFEAPGGTTPDELLRHKAGEAVIQLYGQPGKELQARLDHELDTIITCGYASIFLIMQDILDYARRAGVPYSSRGSAASSLVAHCLGITTPDPIRLNLYFERFLNPMRVTPPDIDTDLCSRRRDQVIRYVYERFGQERVAMVATISRFRERSALREAAKAHGFAPAQIHSLLEKFPHRWYGPAGRDQGTADRYAELAEAYPSERYRQLFEDAQALLGIPRNLSIHPGGVVIAPAALTDLAPVQLAPKGLRITQFDLVSVERLGLLKIDLLGIRGLTVLGDVAEAIGQEASLLEFLDTIPLDDAPTSDNLAAGRTIGCFQIESPGMRATLKEIEARSMDDLMVALALYRPGPLTGGLKSAFVERYRAHAQSRRTGKPELDTIDDEGYLHPALKPLLQETYGVILYQEQVLRIAHELAGFSLSDADLLRRAMSHFDLDKQMQALRAKFIQGAYQKRQVPEQVAIRIWDLMAAFAGYGFPKAHAASYAAVAWRAAWCKTHYPEIFMAAVLANWGGYYSQRVYLTEARRMGLVLKPPLIDHASQEFSLHYLNGQPVLVMGLGQVRDLTQRTIQRILHQRPFHSFQDFLTRVDPRMQEAQNLVRAGCLEGYGSQPGLLQRLSSEGWRASQLSLFTAEMLNNPVLESESGWNLEEQVAAQEEILGVSLAAHPLELVGGQIASSGALSTIDAAGRPGSQVRVAGMRQTWRRSRSARGEAVYFMSLEDLEGMLDVVISGEIYQKFRRELRTSGPYIIEGMVDINLANNEPILRATHVTIFT
jgi:DNA-directed DNA polymerase III PolC